MTSGKTNLGLSRRTMLKALALGGLAATFPGDAFGQPGQPLRGSSAVLKWLESLARPDGGYAWPDQPHSHLTPTFAVIGCHRLLNQTPPNKGPLAEFVRSHHPSRLKKLEQEHREFEYQQIQSLVWLGEDVFAFRAVVSAWKTPLVYLKQYEQQGNPILRHEVAAFTCRELLQLPLDDLAPNYVAYLDARRRANGSFNNTPASDGADGHVLNTWWGLQALRVMGRAQESKADTLAWLQACQLENGGFTCQPKPEFGGLDDVAYTWAAVKSLQLLKSAPAKQGACLAYLLSLWNSDGGFGDRPGWASNPLATYYALGALEALGALDTLDRATPRPRPRPAALPGNLQVFTIQIEAHGQGSPAEAVDLARALRIHLWGAKNAKPAWITRAQALADQRKAPVKFFVANEEYGTWMKVPGLGTYSHISDIVAPAGSDFGPALTSQGVLSWSDFRQRRLTPLQQAGGRLIWQFGENEELVRLFLDDSMARGGYAAISTFHFGNPDFTNSEPFLQRYRGQLPFIALQDAHGNEPWWFADMTTGFRTLFLASEPTWEGWLNALERNWVAAVRHDGASSSQTWMHGGSAEVLALVRQQERQWRWWDNPDIQRPLVSIVPLTPNDEFEAGRPKQGVAIRVRCAWENTTQGLPKKPIAELVRLIVDAEQVKAPVVSVPASRGAAFTDCYHAYQMANPAPGKHTVTALVRTMETKAESSRTVEFHV
jgi:prenyltransferase beta subunit